MKFYTIPLFLCATLMISGCATKRYDRLQSVSGAEALAYDCKDINLELAKVAEARRQVAEGSQINLMSVAGFLGDFGIGNALEKSAAEKTIADRESGLMSLKAEKGCN